MFGFLGAGFNPGVFEAHYRAMPLAFTQNKQNAEYGDKVILPPSALDRLAAMHIEYPMLFKVESAQTGRTTHCGVLEFVADEGVVYMPHWMMQNLLLEVGNMVKFRNVSLPKGTYVKLQPVTSDFLDITNPKAVLERTLRGYTCLTVGDCFVVNYNNKNYEIEVRDAKPAKAISVVETDCQVDFEAPKDYKEPERVPPPAPASKPEPMQEDGKGAGPSTSAAEPAVDEEPTFLAFAGTSRRLDGKAPTNPEAPKAIPLAQVSAYAAAQKRAAEAAAAASAPQPSSSSGASGSGAGSRKAGTFVGFTPTGNRLLDKLAREKAAAGNPGGAPPPPPPPEKDEKKEEESNFKPFAGKGYSLK